MPPAAPSRNETFPLLKKKKPEQQNGDKKPSLFAADNPNHQPIGNVDTRPVSTGSVVV
jgi:hypothetical protein